MVCLGLYWIPLVFHLQKFKQECLGHTCIIEFLHLLKKMMTLEALMVLIKFLKKAVGTGVYTISADFINKKAFNHKENICKVSIFQA